MIRAMSARVIVLTALAALGASTIVLSQSPRDTYSVGAGIVHWHGARPESPLTQVAISFGTTTWLEKVSDEQYRAAAK